MPGRVPLSVAFFLALALPASSAPRSNFANPAVRAAGGASGGWIIDPLLVRGADGKAIRPALIDAVGRISILRAGTQAMQAVSRNDEIDELSLLLEDVLGAAPLFGVQLYFAPDNRGVEARWPDPLGPGYYELSGRFEKALIDDGPDTGLALSLWARKVVGGMGPSEALVAQYIGRGEKLEVKARDRAARPDVQYPQSLDVARKAGTDPEWMSAALRHLPESSAASVKPGLRGATPASAVFAGAPDTLPCDGQDVSGLFPDPASGNQGDVASCHIFAALAPLEAALYRMYGLRVRLSEADLFVRSKVRSVDFWKSGWSDESGETQEDFQFVKKHGVALARSASYTDMEPRYTKLREKTQHLIEQVKAMPDAGSLDGFVAARDAATGHEAKALLGAPSQALDDERRIVKEALAPVALEHRDYGGIAAGVTQRKDLIDYLCKGIPVAIGMNLVGLPEWGNRGATRDAEHAFIIKGFRRTLENGVVFTTRNSWGDVADSVPSPNPDIPESLLSRVEEIDVALPGDPVPGMAQKLKPLAEPR